MIAMFDPALVSELREALEKKEHARERWAGLEAELAEVKARALEARKEYRAACDVVEEVEEEWRTGLTGVPLVDAAASKASAVVAAPTRIGEWGAATAVEPDDVARPTGPPPRPTKADETPVRTAKGSRRGASTAAAATSTS